MVEIPVVEDLIEDTKAFPIIMEGILMIIDFRATETTQELIEIGILFKKINKSYTLETWITKQVREICSLLPSSQASNPTMFTSLEIRIDNLKASDISDSTTKVKPEMPLTL